LHPDPGREKCLSVKFRIEPRWALHALLLSAAALGAGACSGEIECKTEVATGAATFLGKAVGKADNDALRRESLRDACRQKCGAEKAVMIDACAATCVTDVGATKLGGRTTCGRK
jgi:hypothetical protein